MKYPSNPVVTKNKITLKHILPVLGLALSLPINNAFAQEYKKITRLGTSQSVCQGGANTPEELQAFFAKYPDRIRAILADSGWSGSAEALLAAIAAGEFVETSYPVGTRLAWTGAKVNGEYVANPYREWAGKTSFEAFQLNLSTDCQVYDIAIPKACCNVSLISVTPDESAACQAPVPVAAAPVAPVVEPEPAAVPLSLIPFFGAFVGTETRARYEEMWDMDMHDSSGIVGLRAGLSKPLSIKNSLFTQLSYYDRQGINNGIDYPENNFAVDVGFERRLSEKAFIGGGIGAWNVDDSDFRDASLFGHVGGDFGESDLQWFLEGRVFDSDSETLDSFSDNKMFSLGVRYLVK